VGTPDDQIRPSRCSRRTVRIYCIGGDADPRSALASTQMQQFPAHGAEPAWRGNKQIGHDSSALSKIDPATLARNGPPADAQFATRASIALASALKNARAIASPLTRSARAPSRSAPTGARWALPEPARRAAEPAIQRASSKPISRQTARLRALRGQKFGMLSRVDESTRHPSGSEPASHLASRS
jgi:hypothetical protein